MSVALTAAELGYEHPEADVDPSGADELDAATLEACRRHEPLALRRFVVRYQRPVFAFLSRMTGAGPHVEDMAQEVFLRAYRALPRYERRARVSTWLFAIAANLVLDARKQRRLPTVPLSDSTPAEDPRTPELDRRRSELREAFERAAACLSDEQRLVLVLAHFHGQSLAQIAEVAGVPENTVKTRLHRARARLRELLSQAWEDYR